MKRLLKLLTIALCFGSLVACGNDGPKYPDAKEMTFNYDTIYMPQGGTFDLGKYVQPADAALGLTWTSSREATATVNKGVVTGIALGKTVISYTNADGSLKGDINVSVSKNKKDFTIAEKQWLDGYILSFSYDAFIYGYGLTLNETDPITDSAFELIGYTVTNDDLKAYKNSLEDAGWIEDVTVSEDFFDFGAPLDTLSLSQYRYSRNSIACDVLVVGIRDDGRLCVYVTLSAVAFQSNFTEDMMVFPSDYVDDIHDSIDLYFVNYYVQGTTQVPEYHYVANTMVYPEIEGRVFNSDDGCIGIDEMNYIYPWTLGNLYSYDFEIDYVLYYFGADSDDLDNYTQDLLDNDYIDYGEDEEGFNEYILKYDTGWNYIYTKFLADGEDSFLIIEYKFEDQLWSQDYPEAELNEWLKNMKITDVDIPQVEDEREEGYIYESSFGAYSSVNYFVIDVYGNCAEEYNNSLLAAGYTYVDRFNGYVDPSNQIVVICEYVEDVDISEVVIIDYATMDKANPEK